MQKNHDLESYWDNVANNVAIRNQNNVLAGDDEPYYRYKRNEFLRLLDKIDFENKRVLEVGSGPGGNLQYLLKKNCKEVVGVDVSSEMIRLAGRIMGDPNIRVLKTNGVDLPFNDNYFDIVFTSTVLQHNTNETHLKELIRNICRVSNSDVIIFERTEKRIKGHATNIGRPVEYYSNLFSENGFQLKSKAFLRIQASYFVCGVIRKLFNYKNKNEGEPCSKKVFILENLILPITKPLDKVIPSQRDLGMLYFKKHI